MDFSFALQFDVLTFLMAFVVFGGWQIAKIVAKGFFENLTDEKRKRLITTINGVVAVVYTVIIVSLGITTNFWEALKDAGTVFMAGSFYDLLKAYGAIK